FGGEMIGSTNDPLHTMIGPDHIVCERALLQSPSETNSHPSHICGLTSHTEIAFVSKPPAEPPEAETSLGGALVKLGQIRGPNRSRTAAIERAAVSASERVCWPPIVPRPSLRRKRKIFLTHRSPEDPTHTHTPTPRQKPMVPLSSRMHQSTGSSLTPRRKCSYH
ncbi:hypothetical protein H4582DRAFT_1965002, partial [Lactarius indigo]